MGIKINLKKATRVVLPADDYPTRVDVVEFRPGGKTGQGEPTLHIEAVVEDSGTEEFEGTRLFRDQSMQEQSMWGVLEFVQACVGAVEGDAEGEFEFEPADLVDAMVIARVGIDDTFDGRPRNNIVLFLNMSEWGPEEGEEGATEEGAEAEGEEAEAVAEAVEA